MKSIINFVLILAVLIVVGCATTPQAIVPDKIVVPNYVYADCGTPPKRTKVQLRVLSWQVIDGRFSMSAKGYEDLSYNVSQVLAAVKEFGIELEYYEKCLARENS